jgi:hypothetical protein
MELLLVFLVITIGLILIDGFAATAGRDSRLTFRDSRLALPDDIRPWI